MPYKYVDNDSGNNPEHKLYKREEPKEEKTEEKEQEEHQPTFEETIKEGDKQLIEDIDEYGF